MKIPIGNVRGKDGKSLQIKGSYESLEALKAAHESGEDRDAYNVGGKLYIWDGTNWVYQEIALGSVGNVTARLGNGDLGVDVRKSGTDVELTFNGLANEFKGATETLPGKAGLVPAPKAGEDGYVLYSDGRWRDVNLILNETPTRLENLSWDADIPEISEKAAKDPGKYASLVGLEKTFSVAGMDEFTAVVRDVAHYDKADGSGKAGIVFGYKFSTPAGDWSMNPTDDNTGGYPETDMYKTKLPALLEKMQSEVRDAIVEVNIPYNIWTGQTGGTDAGDSFYRIEQCTAKLFLPSNREEWGTRPITRNGDAIQEPVDRDLTGADGTQLAYWALHPTIPEHVIYNVKWKTVMSCWYRSCGPFKSAFMKCSVQGYATTENAKSSSSDKGVAPLFNI